MEKEEIPRCDNCNKKIDSPKRRFCSLRCNRLYSSKDHHMKSRDKKEYQEQKRRNMKNWYEKNKERQKEHVRRNYKTNKHKWKMRDFSGKNKEEIKEFWNAPCFVCGKPDPHIFSTKVFDLHLLPKKVGNPNWKKDLRAYVKKNLIGVCSMDCLGRLRRK